MKKLMATMMIENAKAHLLALLSAPMRPAETITSTVREAFVAHFVADLRCTVSAAAAAGGGN